MTRLLTLRKPALPVNSKSKNLICEKARLRYHTGVMPVTLASISRRQFIARTLAGLTGALIVPRLAGARPTTNPHRFALLADTHINSKLETRDHNANLANNLTSVAAAVAGLDVLPAAAFVVGDLAHQTGEIADYEAFVALLDPVRGAGLPVHLALGNHDHRTRFLLALPPAQPPVVNRCVAVVRAERANFFILDSLDQTNAVPGRCGESQLHWLTAALDARHDLPAIIVIHHQPDEHDPVKTTGLMDTHELLEVLRPRRQVKAIIFGHTHDWHVTRQNGLHLINLPPVAYVFAAGRPTGWVDLQLENDGARLELYASDPTHAEHRQPLKLAWR